MEKNAISDGFGTDGLNDGGRGGGAGVESKNRDGSTGFMVGRRDGGHFSNDDRLTPNKGDTVEEGADETLWSKKNTGKDFTSDWDPDTEPGGEVYNMIVDPRDGEGDITDTWNAGSEARLLPIARRMSAMQKISQEHDDVKQKEIMKELGISLNKNGMPFVDFRDGTYAEIRKKAEDCRRRHQGVDSDTEFMVVLAYPSLGYENEIGIGGYKTIKSAENMLTNYARVHIARGLTYTP